MDKKITWLVNEKLQRSVSAQKVYNWLRQFPSMEEQKDALSILEKTSYFSDVDIYKIYDAGLKKIIAKIPQPKNQKQKIYILPIDSNLGKSGVSMLYYVSHTPVYKAVPKARFKLCLTVNDLFEDKEHNSEEYHIILVDDIIGSGKTLERYLNKELYPKLTKICPGSKIFFHVLCVVYMSAAQRRLESLSLKNKGLIDHEIYMYGAMHRKCFTSKEERVWKKHSEMLRIRKLAAEYGQRLGKTDFLGYENTQALVVFSYTTPNNTLPIIWKTLNNDEFKWNALYPRFVEYKISDYANTRKIAAIWGSVASHMTGNAHNQNYSKQNLNLYLYLELLGDNLSLLDICSQLKLSQNELDDVRQNCLKFGWLDAKDQLTESAHRLLLLMKRAKEKYYKNDYLRAIREQPVYVPSTFRGKT